MQLNNLEVFYFLIELTLDDFTHQIKNGQINYFNCYNTDLSIEQYLTIKHYKENPEDNIKQDQSLSITFHDIEVYCYHTHKFKVEDGAVSPISAITIYSNKTKEFHAYFLILPHIVGKMKEAEILEKLFFKKLKDEKYLSDSDNQKIKIYYYHNDEIGMITDCFKKIHEINDNVLSGYNSKNYDTPYIYNRLMTLTKGDKEKVGKIMSQYGTVKVKNFSSKKSVYIIPEFVMADLMHLYVPRDEPFVGGLGYGKKQSSYTLDNVAEMELGIRKVDYGKDNTTLDDLYDKDPELYLYYNIVDVAIIDLLNIKSQHVDLHNLLRRSMMTPISSSFVGPSALFDTYFSYELEQQNLYVRSGIIGELNRSISEFEVGQIYKPIDNSMKWDIDKLSVQETRKIISRYPGAFVKESEARIIDSTDRVLADED